MPSSEPEIPDDQLIHEGISQNPYPFWFWLFLFTIFISLIWGFQTWYQGYLHYQFQRQPFLQVTNRELSVFLWQNPEHMRVNAKSKTGYLPAFQFMDKVTVEVDLADRYVQAPPELLFLYHTWNRQIRDEFPRRSIPPQEFLAFLEYAEEWQPLNWPGAPAEYKKLIEALPTSGLVNLQELPENVLPLAVRLAFQGWKNYFKEGTEINAVHPSKTQMEDFLKRYPHYARPFWRNIVGEKYLATLLDESTSEDAVIPSAELPPFLRAAFFNDLILYRT